MGWFTDVRTRHRRRPEPREQSVDVHRPHGRTCASFLAEPPGRARCVLIDEIAVGTDPEQGAALAQAVLEALAARGVTAHGHHALRAAQGARRHRSALRQRLGRLRPGAARADVQAAPRRARQLGRARGGAAHGPARPRSSSAPRELLGDRAVVRSRICWPRSPSSAAASRRSAPPCSPSSRRSSPSASRSRVDREQARAPRLREADARRARRGAVARSRQARREIDEVRRRAARARPPPRPPLDDVKQARRTLVAARRRRRPARAARHACRRARRRAGRRAHARARRCSCRGCGRAEIVALPPRRQGRGPRSARCTRPSPIGDVLLDIHRSGARRDARGHARAEREPRRRRGRAPAPDRRAGRRRRRRRADRPHASTPRSTSAASAPTRRSAASIACSTRRCCSTTTPSSSIHGHGTGALRTAIREHLDAPSRGEAGSRRRAERGRRRRHGVFAGVASVASVQQ